MSYDLPTAQSIKDLWPQFANVPDATINAWIAQATRYVDTSWLESDYTYAIQLLTAYFLVRNGYGTGVAAEMSSQGMDGLTMVKSGQLTVQRASSSQSDSGGVPDPWNANRFGVEWWGLARKNHPPMLVAAAPIIVPGARACDC